MSEVAYNRGLYRLASGATNGLTSDIRMLLIIGSSLPANWDDPSLNTVADLAALATIHSERVALSTKTVVQNDTLDQAEMDAANLAFAAASGLTARAAVLYDNAGGASDAARFLLCGTSTGFPKLLTAGLRVNIASWALLLQAR